LVGVWFASAVLAIMPIGCIFLDNFRTVNLLMYIAEKQEKKKKKKKFLKREDVFRGSASFFGKSPGGEREVQF
jgi:hypothetical protein